LVAALAEMYVQGVSTRKVKAITEELCGHPNGDSCLRLVRALAVETHENWLEQHRYLSMDDLREHKNRPDMRPRSRAVEDDPGHTGVDGD
jgi:transposase-like protein